MAACCGPQTDELYLTVNFPFSVRWRKAFFPGAQLVTNNQQVVEVFGVRMEGEGVVAAIS